MPAAPLVIMCNDSAVDPGRTPPNKYVMKLIANNVPYRITGDATGKIGARTWEEAKEPYADHIIDMITDTYAPNFKSLILKRVVHSPEDMERTIPSAVRGTVCHGAFVPYQMGPMRPIPELSRLPDSGSKRISLRLGQPPGSRSIDGAGTQCCSCHFGRPEVRDQLFQKEGCGGTTVSRPRESGEPAYRKKPDSPDPSGKNFYMASGNSGADAEILIPNYTQ